MRRFSLLKISIALGVAVLGILMLINFQSSTDLAGNTGLSAPRDKTVIAVCPSCRDIANQLDSRRYQVILTGSTAESITLLQTGAADAMLSGRTLKPSEPLLDGHVIREGYSFLSNAETTITDSELRAFTLYTDLSPETIRQSLGVENVAVVDDVYQYLDQGIVITSWDNTDYSRAAIAHVVTDAGDRLAPSRRPTLYCPNECDSTIRADITSLSAD